MQEGRASQTAVMVATARAIAHLESSVPGFADPTALVLLPEEAQARVARFTGASAAPASRRERLSDEFLKGRAQMMAVRTVAIDEEVRAAAAPQVVILGAGFDGRAWRMRELGEAVVFEVDHPDTQRDKSRGRLRSRGPRARCGSSPSTSPASGWKTSWPLPGTIRRARRPGFGRAS